MTPDSVVPVIGLAHGSRHPGAVAAIQRLTGAVDAPEHPARYAFLDLADPTLETVAAELAAAGHRRAIVVPLLFTVAFHATVDVPQAVRAAADAAELELEVADILGTADDVAAVLLAALADAGVAPDVPTLLYAVGSSNAAANAAVDDLADRLARRRPGQVRAAFATCAPRLADVLEPSWDEAAILPLFLADGLLLDPARALAAERGWTLVEPLGERAADLVRDRYRSAR